MMGALIAQHKLAFGLVFARIRRAPMAWLTMVAVIGVTLSLPAMLYVVLNNVERLAGEFRTAPQISVFMTLDATPEQTKEVGDRIRAIPEVTAHKFVPRDEAWKTMQANTDLGDVAAGMAYNPLPDAFVADANTSDTTTLESLQQQMQKWPGVERVQLDAAWVKRLHGLLALGDKLVMLLAALLGFALLIITGNTIRLQIATQHEEIALSRLIGATDRFIRRPFLYAGMLYGIGGGFAALLILAVAAASFNASIAELATLYASDFRIALPVADLALTLIGGSAVLGWVASFFAVNRALADIENY